MTDESLDSPLYQQVKRDLLAAIARGEYESGRPFVTQRELCARYGVSTTTAVRALRDLVADGVLVRRRGLGTYVAEPTGRGPLSARGSAGGAGGAGGGGSIAYIAPHAGTNDGPHQSAMLAAIDEACLEQGFRLFITTSVRTREQEAEALRRAVEADASGILLFPVDGHHPPDPVLEVQRRGIPLVMLDRYREDVATDAVTCDNVGIALGVTGELVAAGHTRIATLWAETACTSVRDRMVGHLRALHDHGLPVRADFVVLRDYPSMRDEERLALLSSLVEGPDGATALLCAHGGVLTAVAYDLLTLGIPVPGRVELASLDHQAPYAFLPFTAASAELPSRTMGAVAMRLLVERMHAGEHPPPPRHVVLPARVRPRRAEVAGPDAGPDAAPSGAPAPALRRRPAARSTPTGS